MQAQIIKIADSSVQIKTDFGTFCGNWMSGVPIINATYLVEINSIPVTDINQIQLSTKMKPFIYDFGSYTLINGFVEEIEDNIMFLRLSYNLMMIEICCDLSPARFQERWVNVKVHRFDIYGELIHNTGDGLREP